MAMHYNNQFNDACCILQRMKAHSSPQPTQYFCVTLQMANIFNPVQGPRDAQVRAGVKPHDHARSNRDAVREASQLNALRKQQEKDAEKLQGEPWCN